MVDLDKERVEYEKWAKHQGSPLYKNEYVRAGCHTSRATDVFSKEGWLVWQYHALIKDKS